MENTIVTTEKKELSANIDYKQEALKWLESTGNLKKFTENEKDQFFNICCAFQLNPIKKEVYGVKYGDNFNIIVGYETYLKRATRTGLLDGFNTTTEKTADGDIKAVCTIYRKDWTRPFIHEVYLSEYNTHKSLWTSKPITMIKKVAEAQAFRKCFPDELGGLPYTKEELPEEMTTDKEELKNVTPEAPASKKEAPSKDLLQLKSLLEDSVYANEEKIFTEIDKANYRASIREIGVKATLKLVQEEKEARIIADAEKLQNEALEVEAVEVKDDLNGALF